MIGVNKEEIPYFIAGLWEGDGHIIVKNQRTRNFTFAITFNNNNIVLAQFILDFIGFGYLREKKREHATVLTIGNSRGLLSVVQLLNGKLRTPKIYKFNLLVDWVNNKYNLKIKQYSPDLSNLLNNYWLAGFSEADANFYIRISQNKKKSHIAFIYRFDQRVYDPISKMSYEPCLSLIAKMFNVTLRTIKRKKNTYFHISITKQSSIIELIKYFNSYYLLGIKRLDFYDWRKGFYLYLHKMRITDQLIIDLKKIKNQMNSRRINFSLPILKIN